MQLVNIRPVSQYVPGDLTEVPDGAAYSEFHWAPVTGGTGDEDDTTKDDTTKDEQATQEQAPVVTPVQFPVTTPEGM